MNKEAYHKLLQARMNEEQLIELLILSGVKPSFILKSTKVPVKRLNYILKKWTARGKYNYIQDFHTGYITDAFIAAGDLANLY